MSNSCRSDIRLYCFKKEFGFVFIEKKSKELFAKTYLSLI